MANGFKTVLNGSAGGWVEGWVEGLRCAQVTHQCCIDDAYKLL
jgi:hypothetical protein